VEVRPAARRRRPSHPLVALPVPTDNAARVSAALGALAQSPKRRAFRDQLSSSTTATSHAVRSEWPLRRRCSFSRVLADNSPGDWADSCFSSIAIARPALPALSRVPRSGSRRATTEAAASRPKRQRAFWAADPPLVVTSRRSADESRAC
jgi:hypothetical protein